MTAFNSVQLSADEAEALSVKMRDLQNVVSEFYGATMRGADVGRLLRAFISLTQSINDKLTIVVSDKDTYTRLLNSGKPSEGDVIPAIKYVRNVDEHLLHVVKPNESGARVIGGTFGMRVFQVWNEVPLSIHAGLRSPTQKLRPHYESVLEGSDIFLSMMRTLQFFSQVIPQAVHRDNTGEWTGFPLLHQPGTRYPIHPEEPGNPVEALEWINTRRPSGDLRLVVGVTDTEAGRFVYGMTFVGEYAFTPFVETVDQVRKDLELGAVYRACITCASFSYAEHEFPDALQGAVWRAEDDFPGFSEELKDSHLETVWEAEGIVDFWESVSLETDADCPPGWYFEFRRCRRLNALVPPSFRG